MKPIDNLWSKCVRVETGPRCFLCSQREATQAHHIYPRSRYPEHKYDADFGVGCCAVCHPVLDRTKPEVLLELVERKFPDRAARVRDKIANRPLKQTPKEQRALLRARMKSAESVNWMDLECCDVES
jgi:hypothetical protein